MSNQPFVLERTLKAPCALVWAAFSQAEHLGKWMSPKGMTPGRNTMDFRNGGIYHYEIVAPNGMSHYGRWLFRNVIDHELIACHVSFSDEGAGIVRHPMAPDWPLEMLSQTHFTDAEEGTLIRLELAAVGSDPAQLKTFDDGKASMTQGWGGTFGVLEEYLAQVQNV